MGRKKTIFDRESYNKSYARAYNKKRREQDPNWRKDSQAKRLQVKHANKIKAVELLGGKCSNCGYNSCLAALDFHHYNPQEKEFRVSQVMHLSWNKIEVELRKCVLLCSNCHREFHYKQTTFDPTNSSGNQEEK